MAHPWIRLRCAVVWLIVTAGVAGLADLAFPVLAPGGVGGPGFAGLLVRGCAGAVVVASGWLWLVTTDVAVRVLRDRPVARGRRPGPVRTLVLAACGVIALSGPASAAAPPMAAVAMAAVAVEREPDVGEGRPTTFAAERLAGLPLPDRPTDATVVADPDPPAATVRVRPGDSLWLIAERRLGPRATVADITAYWHRIYDRNATVVGPDPDLILPGQQLTLPPHRPLEEDR